VCPVEAVPHAPRDATSLFGQILGDIARVRQPREKTEQRRVERVVHGVKRSGVSLPQARHQPQLELTIHHLINAHAPKV
jgi:hypothetical protein